MTTDPNTPPTPSIQIFVDNHENEGHEQERGRDNTVHSINNGDQPSGERESRRSSISAFVQRFSSRSRSRSQNRNELGETEESGEGKEKERKYKHSDRKSTEIRGEYANVLKSQLEYMENLREDQLKNGVTHNADGIKIPPPREGRRRSIISALSRGSSRNPSREPSLERTTTKSSTNSGSHSRSHSRTRDGQLDVQDKEYKYSRRKSSEIKGPYADALRSQLEFMENLREDQAKKGITHVDGIEIPAPVNPNVNSKGVSTAKVNLLA